METTLALMAVMTAYDRHCHVFSLDIPSSLSKIALTFWSLMRNRPSQNRWDDGDSPEERTHDGDGDLSLPEDYDPYPLSLYTEQTDSSLQAWERMAIRTFGSGTVDPRPDQNRPPVIN